jgi:hypothetical protein
VEVANRASAQAFMEMVAHLVRRCAERYGPDHFSPP